MVILPHSGFAYTERGKVVGAIVCSVMFVTPFAVAMAFAITRTLRYRRRKVVAQTELETMESGKDYPHVTKPHPCVTR